MMIVFYLSSYLTEGDQLNSILIICGVTILGIISISVFIWNVIQWIKVLKSNLKT